METTFGIIIPYAALAIFFIGFIYRIVTWAKSAVPFRIPTTCGQQRSLSWIKPSYLDNPPDIKGVIGRMVLEIFLFRSLWRNTRAEVKADSQKMIFGGRKWLWLFGLLFHLSLFIILVRHTRLFFEPVPWAIKTLEDLDGAFEILMPVVYVTDILVVAALLFLLIRRVVLPQVRYISLPADYFALLLILGIAATGICIRGFFPADVAGVKELAMGVLRFDPSIPESASLSWLFYTHLTMVCVLFAYFPFSKLVHLGGVFFSPTRNMANTNRVQRHINPWDYPVKTHPYHEYEEEFHGKMVQAGLPVEKE